MKLIKTNNDYELFDNEKLIASTKNKEFPNINFEILSEEDCKTIGWIDVEKLADKANGYGVYGKGLPNYNAFDDGYKVGFKTAQSLNDKMFSLEDMIDAYRKGTNSGALYESLCDHDSHDCEEADEFSKSEYDEFIQSLQQNVWDVEVEMEEHCKPMPNIHVKWREPKITNNSIKVLRIL